MTASARAASRRRRSNSFRSIPPPSAAFGEPSDVADGGVGAFHLLDVAKRLTVGCAGATVLVASFQMQEKTSWGTKFTWRVLRAPVARGGKR